MITPPRLWVQMLSAFAVITLIATILYFYQDIHKAYYSFEMGTLNVALKKAIKGKRPQDKAIIIRNALPVLNACKMRFLRFAGYWPDIFNGYNQAAFIENLNKDKKAAVRLLLKSIHYHPNLAETYRAMSFYLEEAGKISASKACRKYSVALLKGLGISPEDRQTCMQEAIAFSSNR